MIHYDGKQNLNKTNKWREWKQTVIADHWLIGSAIWKAVAEVMGGDFWFNSTLQYKEKADKTGYTLLCSDCCVTSMTSCTQINSTDGCRFEVRSQHHCLQSAFPPVRYFSKYILSDTRSSSRSSPHLISGENLLSLLPPSQDQQSGSWVCSFGD